MAKRFTDTEKWKRPVFRTLPPEYKLLYTYLLDTCDHAGIWDEDLELAMFQTGLSGITSRDVQTNLANLVTRFMYRGRVMYLIPAFIEEQYGLRLNPDNKVHQSVLERLQRYGITQLDGELYVNPTPIEPLTSPLIGAKDKDKDKVKDKDKDKDSEYTLCVQAYHDFIKSDFGGGGAPFVFSPADGANVKKVIQYLRELESVKDGRKTPSEALRFIFDNWTTLEPFYQKQIKIGQILSNLPNIIRQLNPKTRTTNGAKPTGQVTELADRIRQSRDNAPV